MKIFIRADGGKDIGLGHVMRMLVLADELRKSSEVIFICTDTPNNKFGAGIRKINESNFKVVKISGLNYVDEIINIQKKYNADLLITDSYNVDEAYFIKLKQYFKVTGYVDDVNKCKMDVDFIINQNINAFDLNYDKTVNDNAKLFLGTKYSMLRDEFRKSFKNKIINKEVKNILLTLGGMDNNCNTLKILDKIKDNRKAIHIVIGSAFSKELIEKINESKKVHKNIHTYEKANMSELMLKCDIAISACGSTLYELCAMRVPAIGIILADNQKYVAEKMKSLGLLFECFDIENINKINLYSVLDALVEYNNMRDNIIRKQRKLVNLYGVDDLANEINQILKEKALTN